MPKEDSFMQLHDGCIYSMDRGSMDHGSMDRSLAPRVGAKGKIKQNLKGLQQKKNVCNNDY